MYVRIVRPVITYADVVWECMTDLVAARKTLANMHTGCYENLPGRRKVREQVCTTSGYTWLSFRSRCTFSAYWQVVRSQQIWEERELEAIGILNPFFPSELIGRQMYFWSRYNSRRILWLLHGIRRNEFRIFLGVLAGHCLGTFLWAWIDGYWHTYLDHVR